MRSKKGPIEVVSVIMADEKLSFEDALTKLEAIVRDVEEGKIGLEDSIRRYEEGVKLLRRCRSILAEAEMKIQKLQTTAEGEVRAEPFDSEKKQ